MLFSLLILPDHLVLQVQDLLDPSWHIALGMAVKQGLVFGQDFIFTYGPCGVLETKLLVALSKWQIFGFEVFVLILILYFIHLELKKYEYQPIAFLTIFYVLYMSRWSNMVHWLPILFFYSSIKFVLEERKHFLMISLLLAVLLFFIKVNYGLVLGMILGLILIFARIQNVLNWKEILSLSAIYGVLIVVFSQIFKVQLTGYLQSSWHIIDAYNEAMYIPIQFKSIRFWFSVLMIFTYSVILLKYLQDEKYQLKSIFISFLCAGYFFLIWKNGFVRADDHRAEFLRLSVFPFVFLLLIDAKWKGSKLGYVWAFFAPVIFYYLAFVTYNQEYRIGLESFISPFRMNYFSEIFSNQDSKSEMKRIDGQLPYITPTKLNTIGNASVDIVPWEISEIYSNQLNYRPRPSVQSYAAYDLYLDSLNALKYRSKSSPEYIVFSLGTIDDRLPVWDESITKRTLFSHYELDTSDFKLPNKTQLLALKKCVPQADSLLIGSLHRYTKIYCEDHESRISSECSNRLKSIDYRNNLALLLKKRTKPLVQNIIREECFDFKMNEKLLIKKTNNSQYLYLKTRYTWLGKLQRFLIQPPELMVELEYQNGGKKQFRAIKSILETGVLLNKQVDNNLDFASFLASRGQNGLDIKSIRFISEYGFEPEMEAKIRQVVFDDSE